MILSWKMDIKNLKISSKNNLLQLIKAKYVYHNGLNNTLKNNDLYLHLLFIITFKIQLI